MVEAQRYPDDYEGVIAAATLIPYTRVGAVHLCWTGTANLDQNGNPIMSQTKLPMIHQTAIDAFDRIDGLVNGIIEDPRQCHFDPIVLKCPGTPGPSCLTAEELEVVRKIYRTPHDSTGKPLMPGGPQRGSELNWINNYIKDSGESTYHFFGGEFVRYLAFENDPRPNYGCDDFDFDLDPSRLAFMESIYGASNPDLRAFRDRGSKIIAYQGWGDNAVTPLNSIDYYETVVKTMGGLLSTVPGIFYVKVSLFSTR